MPGLKLRINILMGLYFILFTAVCEVQSLKKKNLNPKEGKVGSWLCKEVALKQRLLMPLTEELF